MFILFSARYYVFLYEIHFDVILTLLCIKNFVKIELLFIEKTNIGERLSAMVEPDDIKYNELLQYAREQHD